MKPSFSRTFLVPLLCVTLALPANAQSPADVPAGGVAAMDVRDADIRAFIQDVARATGTTFIVDPRVQGTVSFSRDQPMTESELIGVLLAILRANGLVAVPTGAGAYRVVPDDTAAQQPGSAGGSALGFATEVFPLSRVDARVAAETLKPLVGRGGMVMALPQGNSLLVADYADNLRRLRRLVAQIDTDRTTVDTVTLRNSSAAEIAATVNQLFGMQGADGASSALSVLPVESSNSIVVRGDATLIGRVVQMILELDRRAEQQGNVRVVKLQHADADELLPVLQQLVGQSPSPADATAGMDPATVAAAAGGAGAQPAQVISPRPGSGRRPTIVRYPGSNALIINADPETQRTLMDVIGQLDVRRQQVLVEAIVVEISDAAARDLGVQIAAANEKGVPFGLSQFRNSGPGITELAGAALLDRDDDSDFAETAREAALQSLLGLSGGLAGIAGSAGDTLFGLIINAVRSDTGSNLLSTPSIMTLDNEEARILVGQEVPITTGEVLGDGNTNPFRTIERKNVGIQLEVTPQINAGGGITLQLRQEVSSVAGSVSSRSDELIFNTREIETRVLVDDGAIVVLGGLLDQNERASVDKVPLLGDIPLLGSLFRSTSRSKAKTNLMVFLRPTIIRDSREMQAATAPRYDYMRDAQLQLPRRDEGERAAIDALVQDYLRTQPPVAPAPAAPSSAPAATPPSDGSAPATRDTAPAP
ncbi:MAG: type II secretion system protein GspD [Lysobacterales bacterium RIFOXYD1_FULL_69_11]|nr:MAG: type II secretion system protein GspD [Xanthomonadales bacterium RIFOXYA1_FULL_69_10]OHE86325.1 MAG: type II secretion system protein GspD [Xanthomonadales bacterium RIFOXYD1_FULL_69_11]